MKQGFILTREELVTLQRGGSIPMNLGGEETHALMLEPAGYTWNGPAPPHDQPRKKRKRYSDAGKQRLLATVDKATKAGESTKAVCARLGISESLIYGWRRSRADR